MRNYAQRNQRAEKHYPVRNINLKYIYRLSSFREVNTVHFHYKDNVLILFWIISTSLLVLTSIEHTDVLQQRIFVYYTYNRTQLHFT